MKKKKYITLIAALTLSSAFVLNGCSLALPGEETKISTGAELSAEQEILTDGNVQLYTHWYNADGSRLAGATVTVYEGNDQLFQGTTDENGNLEACTLPGNKELRCVITDASEMNLQNLIFYIRFPITIRQSPFIQHTERQIHRR